MVEIAQKIGAPALATIVDYDANCRNDKHNGAGGHTQPGLVHVSLPNCTPFAGARFKRHPA